LFDAVIGSILFFAFVLPILIMGIVLIILGILSFNGHTWAYKISLGLIIINVMGIVGGFNLFLSNDLEYQESFEKNQVLSENMANLHTIKDFGFLENNETGFKIYIDFSGEVNGNYYLNLFIREGGERIVYSNFSEEIVLESGTQRFEKYYLYEDVFEKCFTDESFFNTWVCKKDLGGYGFLFTLVASIEFIENEIFSAEELEYNFLVPIENKIKFSMDVVSDGTQIIHDNFLELNL
jgi:ABC-type multidrug transport system fused ATPase/permease subunit